MSSLTCLLAATLLAGDVPRDQVQRDDLDQLQGTWKVERVEMGGQAMPGGLFTEMRMQFEGNNLSIMLDKGLNQKSRFTLIEGTQPAGIDIEENQGTNKLVKGIYQLDDDTLRICMEEGNGGTSARPKNFDTKGGDRVVLIILKRVQK